MNSRDFTQNHYVPQWYQKLFLPNGRSRFHYLDLIPETVCSGSNTYKRRELLNWGTKRCFKQADLYTTVFGGTRNTEIERFFFGRVDDFGSRAHQHFLDYEITGEMLRSFEDFLRFISIQKLRTPKGLMAFSAMSGIRDKNDLLIAMQRAAHLHCAIWTDAVWEIVSAENSNTKFLLTDHPVTHYNMRVFPGSANRGRIIDADIRRTGTHTLFPLSFEKMLIFTNLSWTRNPYQNPLKQHPNPKLMRDTIWNSQAVQTERHLSEEEVLQVNYVMKSRALRFVAAAEKDWLFPERELPSTHWSNFGKSLLFMPEPRNLNMGGEIFVRYEGGGSDAWNEYGHKPWEPNFKDEARSEREWKTLERFKDEFAARFGPKYRSVRNELGVNNITEDNEEHFRWRINRHKKRARQ